MKPFLLSCYLCKHYFKNDNHYPCSINGKRIKQFEKYCGFFGKGKKMVRSGVRDKPKGRFHPAWCPRYEEKESCLYCGKPIYADQGDSCNPCKRKNKK